MNVVSLVCLTLSLCSLIQEDECDAVLIVLGIPVPIDGMPSVIGDVSCAVNLAITALLLLRRVVTQRRCAAMRRNARRDA